MKVKFIAYLLIITLSLIVLNFGCNFLMHHIYQTSIYSSDYQELKLKFYKDKDKKQYVHPYFGFASTKDKIFESKIGNDNIFHAIDRAGVTDEIKVLIIGGSVAAYLSKNEGNREHFKNSIFYHELNRVFKTQRFSIYNAAFGGGKQPQNYFKLVYLDLLGFKPDLVINIDGFNEIALNLSDNYDASILPLYPRSFNRAIARTALDKHCMFSSFLSQSNSKIPLIELISLIYLNKCHNDINISAIDKPYWSSSNLSYDDYVEQSINLWAESSNHTDYFLRKKNIPYIHVIQPNQYFPDSKKLSKEEEENYLSFPYYGKHIEMYYERLNTNDLTAKNVSDLRYLFLDERRTTYSDNCCHLNDLGNKLMIEKIISDNYELFKYLIFKKNINSE